MQPTIFGVPSFGIVAAFGILTAYLIATRLARRSGVDPEVIVDGTLICMIAGVAGCRLLHVVENWSYFRGMPWHEVLRVDKGGLSWYGSFVTIFPSAVMYVRWKRMRFFALADIFIAYTILGQAVGRIGCFLYGCCWGYRAEGGIFAGLALRFPVGSPAWTSHALQHLGVGKLSKEELSAAFPTLPPELHETSYAVIPSQLMLSAAAFVVFALFLWYYGRHKRHGEVFAVCFTLLAVGRFIVEFVREDSPHYGPLTDAQWFSIPAVLAGLVLLALVRRFGAPRSASAYFRPEDASRAAEKISPPASSASRAD